MPVTMDYLYMLPARIPAINMTLSSEVAMPRLASLQLAMLTGSTGRSHSEVCLVTLEWWWRPGAVEPASRFCHYTAHETKGNTSPPVEWVPARRTPCAVLATGTGRDRRRTRCTARCRSDSCVRLGRSGGGQRQA
ncbi:predicted protein [Chaetomium globosum CBS 148.51]|uniref:Uncharacterized protein n=1 Tax=Chaetomium globosum (strain ATCC 6205 / CBS 148.51 / DSM 1962 / NBRC 6347 / NRRL 1970) TaxID=306901 RepID=Q2GRJ6_CHAGB|nr:uncharacterized protein CHGG_09408 [Chaetomium globosum CBS 148.51]EAQ85394.1 predicted protein [Chaetomium globosum CBS 148.51]